MKQIPLLYSTAIFVVDKFFLNKNIWREIREIDEDEKETAERKWKHSQNKLYPCKHSKTKIYAFAVGKYYMLYTNMEINKWMKNLLKK